MNPERVIPGQVVPDDSDDNTTPRPQETFLHKVASGPFTPSGTSGSYTDDDTEVMSAAEAGAPAPAGTTDTYPADTGTIDTDTPDAYTPDTDTIDTDTPDAYTADTDTAAAGTADADPAAADVTAVDAVVVEAAEADATGEDSTAAAETGTGTATAQPPDSPDGKVADSDEPLLGETAGRVREEWRLVQASFVDDPRASVAAAAGVVADAAARLESLLRERQRSLRGSWDGNGQADTETLRQLMLTYRRLLTKLIS
jgi:hypothetical protein